MYKSTRRTLLVLMLAFLATMLFTGRVSAHANVIRSDPSNNAVLAEAPREVRLWFNEPISAQFSTAQLLDINGQSTRLAGIRRDDADATLLILTLPNLPEGVYSVNWRVLSEADGHSTRGVMVFGVGSGADVGAAAGSASRFTLPPMEVSLRWINFSILAALLGALGMASLVLKPQDVLPSIAISITRAQNRVIGWAGICAGLAFGIGLGLLFWQTSVLKETLPAGVSLVTVAKQILTYTRWGTLWSIRQGVLIVLAIIVYTLYYSTREMPAHFQAATSRKLRMISANILAVALLVLQALSGHAAALSPGITLAIIVDSLHLLAASLWVGGLLALIVGVIPILRQNKAEFTNLVKASWGSYGKYAALSVGVVFATGLYNTGRQVASLDALLTTLYGQLLLSKIGLMLVVGAFGGLNSMMLHPQLAAPLARLFHRPIGWTPIALKRLPYLVLVEFSLGFLIFLFVGLLTSISPARGPEFAPSASDLPNSLSQGVDDLLVSFSAQPNQPGENLITIRAVSTRRPPPAPIMRVILRFTFQGQDLGTSSLDAPQVEPGLYQVGGSSLSMTGKWQIQVIVRRKGIEDSTAIFDWTVASPGKAHPRLISNQPWSSILGVLAGMILAGILLAAVLFWGWNHWRGTKKP